MKLNKLLLHFMVADFIGLVKFEWYSQTKVGDIDILLLWRVYEKLYRTQLQQPSRGRNHLRQQRRLPAKLRDTFLTPLVSGEKYIFHVFLNLY